MRILQKIILLICLIIPVSGFAALNENIDKVFQINAYTIDSDTQVYYPIQYGSSVYIGKNQILTNAHVVLDYKDQPIGNYEVCKTLNFKQKPICFSVAKLLYFDIKNDLALLEISNPNVAAIQLNNKDLSLGETVKVLGYPSNGGDTISYTEGKISGYTDGLYKIDANIDSGNSGGGVFDSEGNLIGLSVSVMVGYSTMGYVIPVSTINEFVSQKKTSNITQYSNGISSSFLKYFHYKEKLIGSTSYNDPYVQFKNLQKYGFKVSDIHQNISGELFETQFLNNDTKIYIYNDIIYGGKYDIEEDVKAASKIFQEYKQKNIIQDYRVEMMKLFGKKTIFVYNKYNKDSTLFTFIIETQENHRINIQIRNSSGKIDKTIIQAFKMVLLDMNLTGKTLPHNPLKNDIISDFVVGDYQDIQIGKNVSGVNFVDIDYNMESLATKFGTYFSFFEPNDTLEFIFNALPIIGDYDMDNELENVMIKKTKSNHLENDEMRQKI